MDGVSCEVDFSPWFVELINILFLLILPTGIIVPIVFKIIQHVRLSQNTVRSVRRIHRYLIIQSVVLYTFWLVFFIPVIIFMFPIAVPHSERCITRILDITAILFDALVITSFDRRFIDAWKKSVHKAVLFFSPIHERIHPLQTMQLRTIRSIT